MEKNVNTEEPPSAKPSWGALGPRGATEFRAALNDVEWLCAALKDWELLKHAVVNTYTHFHTLPHI